MQVIKGLVAGKTVTYRDTPIQFPWVKQGHDLPMWGAGYGPRALRTIGQHADGFVLQLADPQILEWTRSAVIKAATEHGRPTSAVTTCVVAPAYVGDNLAHQRDQLRWFGGMVGNHVADIVARYGEDSQEIPKALTDYIKNRADYDYSHHGRADNPSTDFVPDDIVDRFCVLGPVDEHINKLRMLRDKGTDHFAIYLMHDREDETLEAYGRDIVPVFDHSRPKLSSGQPRPPKQTNDAPAKPSAGYSGRTGIGYRPALLVVDFINGFTDPTSGIGADYSQPVQVASGLLELFRSMTLPVVFTTHVYEPGDGNKSVFVKKVPALGVLVRGSQWVKIDERVRPQPDERVFEKQSVSAFFNTMLDSELRSRGVDTVVLVGCTTSGNIRATAVDSMQHGFRTVVVRDGVGDRASAAHEANLADIDAKYGDVLMAEDVISHLRNNSPAATNLARGATEDFKRWWADSPSST